MQAETPFVRSYMDWLAHHEFGQGHRPFLFGGAPPADLSPQSPDYWLDLWTRTHEALADEMHEREIFVCYEDLCTDRQVWARLTLRLGLPLVVRPDFSLPPGQPDRFDPSRLARAEAVYQELRTRASARD
jgi:hypothetical protein